LNKTHTQRIFWTPDPHPRLSFSGPARHRISTRLSGPSSLTTKSKTAIDFRSSWRFSH